MNIFFQAVGCILVAAVVKNLLKECGSFAAIAIAALVSVGAVVAFLSFLSPVLDLIRSIQQIANLDLQMVSILMKAVAIGIVCEICSLICTESGCHSMARSVELIGTGAILWLSVPMLLSLLDLIQKIMEEL